MPVLDLPRWDSHLLEGAVLTQCNAPRDKRNHNGYKSPVKCRPGKSVIGAQINVGF